RTAGGRRRAHPRPRGRGRAGAADRSRRLVGDRRGHGDPPRGRGDGPGGGRRGARGERALVRAAGRRERDDLDQLRARGEAAPLMLDESPGVVADAPADGGRADRSPGRAPADGSRSRAPALSADARGRAALLARVDGRLPELRPAERRVARLLFEQPARATFTSVVELAELTSTSTATVVRCAQQLGFRGFHELKAVLARELAGSSPPAM